MQVLPTAPSPTVTHLMNLEELDDIFSFSLKEFGERESERERVKLREKGIEVGFALSDI